MLRLRDIMATDLLTVAPELTLRDAMELLVARHVSGAPVVAGARVVGVISLNDLVTFAASAPGVPTEREEPAEPGDTEAAGEPIEGDEPAGLFYSELWADAGADVSARIAAPSGPEWNALEEHTVEEVMSRSIIALPPETPIDKAAELMRTDGVHRVLVMDGGALLGLASASDIADAVADHKVGTRTFVFGRKAERDERGWQ